jgi:hypothetical protein
LVGWGNERLRIFASLGGYFGYVINGKDKVTKNINGSEGSPVTTKADYKDVYKNIDAGIRLGGGVQVYVDKKLRSCVTFDVNYDYGFIKAYKTQPAVYSELKITPSKLILRLVTCTHLEKTNTKKLQKERLKLKNKF